MTDIQQVTLIAEDLQTLHYSRCRVGAEVLIGAAAGSTIGTLTGVLGSFVMASFVERRIKPSIERLVETCLPDHNHLIDSNMPSSNKQIYTTVRRNVADTTRNIMTPLAMLAASGGAMYSLTIETSELFPIWLITNAWSAIYEKWIHW